MKRRGEVPKLKEYLEKLPKGTVLKFRGTSIRSRPFRELVEIRDNEVLGMQVVVDRNTKKWRRTGISSVNGIENFEGYYTKLNLFIDRKTILGDYEKLNIE